MAIRTDESIDYGPWKIGQNDYGEWGALQVGFDKGGLDVNWCAVNERWQAVAIRDAGNARRKARKRSK